MRLLICALGAGIALALPQCGAQPDFERNVTRVEPAAADPAIAGIVVTHGTATLEETAYFLNLAVKVPVPVVVVGAMRPSSALGADGGNNLLNAVRVAGAPDAHAMGVMVVLNDEIQATVSTCTGCTANRAAVIQAINRLDVNCRSKT